MVPTLYNFTKGFSFNVRTLFKIIIVSLQAENASLDPKPFTNGRKIVEQSYRNKRIPERALDIMVNSVTSSTLKQYEGPLLKWSKFSKEEGINMCNPQNIDVIKFLTSRFDEGASYGTLNSTRGISKKRPPKPKYSDTWVLEFLEADRIPSPILTPAHRQAKSKQSSCYYGPT
ncbi:uncharacterized protein LOC135161110 [Diachasmimorpha longicaudata]|uniref:uncharacterized protein LOC135161110 n=1 Tax=Diachasmimorpha longicaudata TaxID=58733 RepID=UPI0030B8E055